MQHYSCDLKIKMDKLKWTSGLKRALNLWIVIKLRKGPEDPCYEIVIFQLCFDKLDCIKRI